MDIAIVTGANTRVGLAISQKLIETGCRVYGLGADFNQFPLEHADFVPVSCDLTNTEHLCQVVQEIIDKEKDIYVLVNHARFLNLDPHEKLGLNDLESLVHTNLLAPLILTRLALPSLIRLRGFVLNVGFPDLPGSQRLGSAFLSTEVALQEFSNRLYEEVRKDKVKVCSLILDSANAELMFKEGFTERDNHDLIVCSKAIAQAIDYVVSQKRDSVVSTLVVRPQKKEPDAQDLAAARKLSAPKPYKAKPAPKKVVIGRLKKPEEAVSEEPSPATYIEMAREIAEEEAEKRKQQSETSEKADKHSRPPKRRRRRRRGRGKPEQEGGGPRTKERPVEQSPDSAAKKKPRPKPNKKAAVSPAPSKNPAEDKAKKKAVKKVAAKQDLKKKPAPKKQAAKKAPSKNTVKKGASKKTAAKKAVRKRPAKKAAKKAAKKRAQAND